MKNCATTLSSFVMRKTSYSNFFWRHSIESWPRETSWLSRASISPSMSWLKSTSYLTERKYRYSAMDILFLIQSASVYLVGRN